MMQKQESPAGVGGPAKSTIPVVPMNRKTIARTKNSLSKTSRENRTQFLRVSRNSDP